MNRSSDNRPDLSHEYAQLNGTTLHYVRAGSGPLMMFLHGFPQGWFIWRQQLREFSRDHTVVAADLRGYNLSGKPAAKRDYGTWILAEDARALIEHLGFDRATVVGHDTGGAAGYSLALHYPELLTRLVILTTPHPALFDRELHHNPAQVAASQYLLALRQPATVPLLQQDDAALLRAMLSEHEFFGEADVDEHVAAWHQPRAIEGMVGWYQYEGLGPADDHGTPARGNFVPEVSPLVIETTSLVMYAEHDAYVLPACFSGLERYMPSATVLQVDGASHWLLNECPGLVSQHIRDFLAAGSEADVTAGLRT